MYQHIFILEKLFFWAILPFFNFISLGAVFLFSRLRFLDFMFFIGFGIAISLLSSGLYWKIFGLIIPGSLLAGIIPGVYFPWQQTVNTNPLLQTGMMLVWFALGWGFITVFSRVQTQAFVWWPLIPGGILAMVGISPQLTIIGEDNKLTPTIRSTMFRIIQETVNNTCKYSKATAYEVKIDYNHGGKINLQIKDNGVGTELFQGGYGLLGLKERIELINGRLEIKSRPNEGFQLEIEIPYDKEN